MKHELESVKTMCAGANVAYEHDCIPNPENINENNTVADNDTTESSNELNCTDAIWPKITENDIIEAKEKCLGVV